MYNSYISLKYGNEFVDNKIKLCKICGIRPPNILFNNCKHNYICDECSYMLQDKNEEYLCILCNSTKNNYKESLSSIRKI